MNSDQLHQLALNTQEGLETVAPRDENGYHQNVGIEGYSNNFYGLDIKREIKSALEARELAGEEQFLLADLGCGGGRFLRELYEMELGDEVDFFGVDKTYCNRDLPEENYIVGDVSDLEKFQVEGQQPGISNDTFDIIFSRMCIDWLDDQQAALEECNRILKPGGSAYVTCSITEDEHQALEEKGVSLEIVGYEEDCIAELRGEDRIGALEITG